MVVPQCLMRAVVASVAGAVAEFYSNDVLDDNITITMAAWAGQALLLDGRL